MTVEEQMLMKSLSAECERLHNEIPRWISTSERLPDIHNYSAEYLVTLKRGGVFIGMFTETDGRSWWTYDDVIAWMPLPEPYKEDMRGAENAL